METVTAVVAAAEEEEEADGAEEEDEGVVSLVVTPSNNCEGESAKYLGGKKTTAIRIIEKFLLS